VPNVAPKVRHSQRGTTGDSPNISVEAVVDGGTHRGSPGRHLLIFSDVDPEDSGKQTKASAAPTSARGGSVMVVSTELLADSRDSMRVAPWS
jgi:hypothetical protein